MPISSAFPYYNKTQPNERTIYYNDGKLNEKADTRFKPDALAAISRVFAREAAMKCAEEGLRWVYGANGISDGEAGQFEQSLNLNAIHITQAGMLDDMDTIADVLYDRTT